MTRANPYNQTTYEHRLWEDWNRAFFLQPVHAQLLEIEQQIREQTYRLALLLQKMDENELKRELTQGVLAFESSAEDLGEVAEHQYLALVSKSGVAALPK